MAKTLVMVGALDTKGREIDYVRERVSRHGVGTLVIDFGIMGEPQFKPDIRRQDVMAAADADLRRLSSGEHKDEAMAAAARGLEIVVRRLYDEGRLHGIFGMGGSAATSIATAAMRCLPVGVPKLILSTMGGTDMSAFVGTRDITVMPSVVDVSGLNRVSRRIYANAAAAIAGMVAEEPPEVDVDRPLIVASMFGNTTRAVDHARSILEHNGFEVLVFHANGAGGRTMEGLIADHVVTASLDMTTTELADEVCGAMLSAGPDRCMAASRASIPAVLVPGCVDMANFLGPETVPERYRGRNLYHWNINVTVMRTNAEENRRIGEMLAAAANAATAPVTVLLPLRGVSMLDAEGLQFWDPEADEACFETLRAKVKPGIAVIEADYNINDPQFAELAALTLLKMLAAGGDVNAGGVTDGDIP